MKKIFLDFDEVIVDTIKALRLMYLIECQVLVSDEDLRNKLYRWDCKDIFPYWYDNGGHMGDIFNKKEFFDHLYIKDGMFQLIYDLIHDGYEVIIVTKGTNKNISHKAKYISQNFPDIETIYMNIPNGKKQLGKGLIDMSGGIFVDDNQANLESSNADIKICFGSYGFNKEWNEQWDCGWKVSNSEELKNLIRARVAFNDYSELI